VSVPGNSKSAWLLLAVLFVATCLRLVSLGGTDFFTDESIHAHTARLLVQERISPWDFYNGEQPPVFTWLNGFSVLILGANEFSVRFMSAVLGIAMVILVYSFGREMYGKKAGIVAASITAVMPIHVLYSRVAFSDMALSFFLLLSIYLAEQALRKVSDPSKSILLILSGFAFATAFLTKYNAIVIWGLYWIFLFIFSIRRIPWYEAIISNFSALAAVIALTEFKIKNIFILGYNIGTWSVAQSFEGSRPLSYYLYVLFDGLSPLLFIAFFVVMGYSLYQAVKHRKRKDVILPFLVVGYLLIAFAQARKHPRYLVMILPFISLLMASKLVLLKRRFFYATVTVIVLSCTAFTIYEVDNMNNFHLLSNTGKYIQDNVPANSTIHITEANVYPLKYYIDDEFSNFRWGNNYARGAHLELRINYRLNAALVVHGDYVIVSNFVNNPVGGAPLDDNLIFYSTSRNLYPAIYLRFIGEHGNPIKTLTERNLEVVIYKITQPTGGSFNLPPPAKPSGLLCTFRRFRQFIPADFQDKLSNC
jgi:uncharacterized membrane protein